MKCTIPTELISLSRKKKKAKSGRSLMLSEIMPLLSGDLGEKIQKAIEDRDGERVKALMGMVGDKLQAKFNRNK